MKFLLAGLLAYLCVMPKISHAQLQGATDSVEKISNFPNKLFAKVNGSSLTLDRRLERQTDRYLKQMARREKELQARLSKIDSAKAASLFSNNPGQQYAAMAQNLRNDSSHKVSSMGPQYLPYADSTQSVLGFLNKNPGVLNANGGLQAKMQASLGNLQQLESKMQYTDVINQYIQSRNAQVEQALNQYSHLPGSITNLMGGYKKEAYYYAQQVQAYRSMLNDPDKMMQTALTLLNKLPAFASFMKQNGFLAGIFGVPAGYGTDQGMVGLQSRDQVLSMIQSQIGSGGPNAASALQGSLQNASKEITNLQNKVSSLGAGGGNMEMPDFKPNSQKTKTIWQRLQYGLNLQTQQSTFLFPLTTDIGLSVAYKINDKNDIGLGASYKIGWGSDFQHIQLSSQGAGLRSFADIQLKKSFYLSTGFEYNYQPLITTLKITSITSWTRSGLIGLSKVVSMKSKVFSSTKVQILWDFLSYYQIPVQQPFKFRVGYTF